jgi:hypothetical protein
MQSSFSTHPQTVISNPGQELIQITLVSGKIPQMSTDILQQPPFSGGLRGAFPISEFNKVG